MTGILLQYWKFVQSHSGTLWTLWQWSATKAVTRMGTTEENKSRRSFHWCCMQQEQHLHLFQRHCTRWFSYGCKKLSTVILHYETRITSYLWLDLVKIDKILTKLMIPNDSCLQWLFKGACSVVTGYKTTLSAGGVVFYHILKTTQNFSDPQLRLWNALAKQCLYFHILYVGKKKVKNEFLF